MLEPQQAAQQAKEKEDAQRAAGHWDDDDDTANACIAKVLRTVGSAGSVHSPAGATSLHVRTLDGGLDEPGPPIGPHFAP